MPDHRGFITRDEWAASLLRGREQALQWMKEAENEGDQKAARGFARQIGKLDKLLTKHGLARAFI